MSPGAGRGTPDEKQPEHRPDADSTNQPHHATGDTPGGTPHGEPFERGAIRGKGDRKSDLTPDSSPPTEWQRAEQISESSIVQKNPEAHTGSEGLGEQQRRTAADREQSSRAASAQKASSSRSTLSTAPDPRAGGPPTPAGGIDPRGSGRDDAPRDAAKGKSANDPSGTDTSGGEKLPAYPAGKATSKEDLAQQLGFASFLEFFEGSQPLSSQQSNVWYTSALPKNQWVLWNSQTLEYSRPLSSLEQARQASHLTE